MNKIFFLFFAAVFCLNTAFAQDMATQPMVLNSFDTIRLLPPDTTGGKPLMQVMAHRKSDRQFDSRNLSLKNLSEVLWAAYGINRPNGKRTVPSAMARYPLQVYVALENGMYLYNPQRNILIPVVPGDLRAMAGRQSFVATAPLNILYVAKARNANDNFDMAKLDSGYCGQDVYLYCASEGLKCVTRASVDGEELLKILHLGSDYKFIVAQTVGY